MNLLPLTSSTLVKKLPLHTPRAQTIKYLIGLNLGTYGLYQLVPGPRKLVYNRHVVQSQESSVSALLYSHFFHTSLGWTLFNSAILYTIGNYHVSSYGARHLFMILGLSAVAGSLLNGLYMINNRNGYSSGAVAPTAGLIAYNALKNPAWFKFMLGPVPLFAALGFYSIYYHDRVAFGGLTLGWLAFILGL